MPAHAPLNLVEKIVESRLQFLNFKKKKIKARHFSIPQHPSSAGKESPTTQETPVQFLSQEDALEKG